MRQELCRGAAAVPCSLQVLPGSWCSQPFVTFHQINAFEERGCVVLDLCCQDQGSSLALYTLQNLRRSGEGLDQVRSLPLLPQHLLQEVVFCSKAQLGRMVNTVGTAQAQSMENEMIIS